MLCITRRRGETIIIIHGEDRIVITVVNGQNVKLGIDAPLTYHIHRDESYVGHVHLKGTDAQLRDEGLSKDKPAT